MGSPQPMVYYVFSADRHHVATYSTQAAADAHVASWPASFVSTTLPASLAQPDESQLDSGLTVIS